MKMWRPGWKVWNSKINNIWFEKAESVRRLSAFFIWKEMNAMNEWERLHQQAKRYQAEYPPGTRIMLLSMGRDPNPVEDQTRGTVRVVDDIGTLHCSFDNGRSLGVVPGEDSFRKLTEEELAEEQESGMTEDQGPVMGM